MKKLEKVIAGKIKKEIENEMCQTKIIETKFRKTVSKNPDKVTANFLISPPTVFQIQI